MQAVARAEALQKERDELKKSVSSAKQHQETEVKKEGPPLKKQKALPQTETKKKDGCFWFCCSFEYVCICIVWFCFVVGVTC